MGRLAILLKADVATKSQSEDADVICFTARLARSLVLYRMIWIEERFQNCSMLARCFGERPQRKIAAISSDRSKRWPESRFAVFDAEVISYMQLLKAASLSQINSNSN